MPYAEVTAKIQAILPVLAAEDIMLSKENVLPYGKQLAVESKGSKAKINIYCGKKGLSVVCQGSDKLLLQRLEAILGIDKGTPKPFAPEAATVPQTYAQPWVGTDESGKGDFFGPLVVAGVLLTEQIAGQLKDLGVQDSKKISDKRIANLAAEIRRLCPGKLNVLTLVPEKYNDLYVRMSQEGKRLNELLAWAHASVLENLLEHNEDVGLAVVDQFADARVINARLKKLGRTIEIVQAHRAEANIAVAAASVLAREGFLKWMAKANFPKGAGAEVVETAREYAKLKGRESLAQVAKVHFKTYKELSDE